MRKKANKSSANTHVQDNANRSKGKGDTNVRLKAQRAILVFYQLDSAKHYLEVGEEVTHLSFSWG